MDLSLGFLMRPLLEIAELEQCQPREFPCLLEFYDPIE